MTTTMVESPPRSELPDDFDLRILYYTNGLRSAACHLDTYDEWDYKAYCQACYQEGIDPYSEEVTRGFSP